ncbi:site-2 protease family protein [soil metagenome]
MGSQHDLIGLLFKVAVFFIPFLFSICVHEAAHAWMAKLCGDTTAEKLGRLTLNPLAHADPIGTFLLPIAAVILPGNVSQFIFGWAKPVPYDPSKLRDKKNGPFLIALAGPASNLILAFIGAFFFVLVSSGSLVGGLEEDKAKLVSMIAAQFVGLNCMLAVLNLVPIHPLDGGKIVARFLPYKAARWLDEREQMLSMILLVLFLTGFARILSYPAGAVANLFANWAAGILSIFGVIV